MFSSELCGHALEQTAKRKFYYLTYFPLKDPVQRAKVAKELSSQGGIRLHTSLWKIPSQSIRPVLKVVTYLEPTVLKRSREIMPPQINFNKQVFDLGSVAVIA